MGEDGDSEVDSDDSKCKQRKGKRSSSAGSGHQSQPLNKKRSKVFSLAASEKKDVKLEDHCHSKEKKVRWR